MSDERIRESLKACLAESRFPMEKQREVLKRIQGEKTIVKRKFSAALVLALAAMLALGALAVAAGFGVFGTLANLENSDSFAINGARLGRLDEVADQLDVSAAVAAPTPAATGAPATVLDEVLAHQASRTFDLTIHQAYCDGRNLYYSYTLRHSPLETAFGEGKPTGFDGWDWEEPGYRFAEIWSFEPEDEYQAVCAWFDADSPRYVVRDSVGVADGADVMQGEERLSTMIFDSASERLDDTTIQGFQEVELPETYAPGETIDLTLAIMYSATVTYQDETGVYRSNVRQKENRGYLRVPFSVTVGGNSRETTGTFTGEGYTARATLTFTDVTAYGEVVFDAPSWVDAWAADEAYWMNGAQGEAPEMPAMITDYELVAGGEVLRNIGGGYGVGRDGQYVVHIEFDLPQSMDSLALRPKGGFAGDEIPLN